MFELWLFHAENDKPVGYESPIGWSHLVVRKAVCVPGVGDDIEVTYRDNKGAVQRPTFHVVSRIFKFDVAGAGEAVTETGGLVHLSVEVRNVDDVEVVIRDLTNT